MKKCMFLLLLFVSFIVSGGGLESSFLGSTLPGSNNSTVFLYDATVDVNGNLVDKSGENLLIYSRQLDNVSWTQVALTSVTSNAIKNPIDNTLTVEGLVSNVTDTQHGVTQSVTLTATNHKLNARVRAGIKTWLYLSDNTVANAYSYFDISNGVLGSSGAGCIEAKIKKISIGWYECSIEFLGTAAAHTVVVYSANANLDNDFAGDTTSVSIYATDVWVESKTTLGGYTNIYHTTVAANKPRLDLTASVAGIPFVKSSMQGSNGNRLDAISLQTSGMRGDGTFGAKADKATGTNPRGMETAILRNNGILDLIVSNYDVDTVSVLLGVGNGTFAAKADYATGDGPDDVAIGSLRNNGILDIVVANAAANTVSVLLGTGSGTFGAKTDYATGTVPYDVALGDLRGTGVLDIVVTNKSDDTISVLLGAGDGTFGAKNDYATGADPQGLALGDLRNTGVLDAIVANMNDDTVSVLLGDGLGAFGAKADTACGGGPDGVVVGSFRNNGILDVAVANTDDDTVGILLGNGLGGLAAVVPYGTLDMPRGLEIGRLRGTHLDVAVANYGTNKVSVLLGNGDGTLAAKVDYTTESSPRDVAIGSFRGTGVLDLAVSNMGSNTVSVLLGTPIYQYFSRAHHAAMNVFDQDFSLEMLVRIDPADADASLFSHWSFNTGGIWINYYPGILYVYFDGGGAEKTPYISFTLADGLYHFVSLVRSGNVAQVRIDSNTGPWVDVSGTGLDVSAITYLGAPDYLSGSILYARLDSIAQSDAMLAKDREYAWNLLANNGLNTPSWTYSRSTQAYSEFSTGGIRPQAAGVPRTGRDGGFLGEGQRTNITTYSQTKAGAMSQYSTMTVAFGVNDVLAPDGTMTADSVSDSVEFAKSFTIGQNADSVTSGTVYTKCVYLKKLPTATSVVDNMVIRLINGGHDSEDHFSLSTGTWLNRTGTALIGRKIESYGDGWWRVCTSLTALNTGTLTSVWYTNNEANYDGTGVAQYAIWEGSLFASPFPMTDCPNIATGSTTCTADSLSVPAHAAGTNKDILPYTYGPSPNPASKLTIQFDMKTEYTNGSDLAAYRSFLEIGGLTGSADANTNRLYFGITTPGAFQVMFRTSLSVSKYFESANNPVIYGNWHSYKLFIDFSDLSRSYVTIDGVAPTGLVSGGFTGTASFITTDTNILIANRLDTGLSSFISIKNLRIESREW